MPRAEADDWFPLSKAEHRRQLQAILGHLGPRPRRVLDLGCGDGRITIPLRAAGHHVLGIDRDRAAVRRVLDHGAEAMIADFLATGPASRPVWAGLKRRGAFDSVICVGHTFMLAWQPREAMGLLSRIRALLRPAGTIILDDFGPLWREVACGNWQEGISPDGSMQLLWAPGDSAVAIRRGAKVRKSNWRIGAGDQRLRLWSLGELELLGAATGFELVPGTSGLTVLRRTRPAD